MDVKLNNVYFLGDDNPAGWSVTATVYRNDVNPLGVYETVTLHGVRNGVLDFDYQVSVSKTGHDIVVRLDRANNTATSGLALYATHEFSAPWADSRRHPHV